MRIFLSCILLILIGSKISFAQETSSWAQAKAQKKGTIKVFWYTTTPFIQEDENGDLNGIEYDILENFKGFVKEMHDVDLEIIWQKSQDFAQTIDTIASQNINGTFGASAISITHSRKQRVTFSPSYMSDIAVMISSKDVPIVTNPEEFNAVFDSLKAVTIKGTTYESDLERMKQTRKLNFDISYISSDKNVLRSIEGMTGAFGYIDLPIYLLAFSRNTTVDVNRQNLFAIKREGYGVIMPKDSDWAFPMHQYFTDPTVKKEIEGIIGKYIDFEIYSFIESYYHDNISLLTKEKEMQYRDLLKNSLQIQRDSTLKYSMLVMVSFLTVFAFIVLRMYRKKHKTAIILANQKTTIESQRKDLETQKIQLEKRNDQMTLYNEEKNNLIKILAHDLRTPINHINGMAHIFQLENKEMTDDNKQIIQKILDTTVRLNGMISKILDIDAIEANRVNIHEEKVDLNQLLDRMVKTFKTSADQKHIEIKYHPTSVPAEIMADSHYLEEVFENLLSNAIKFSNTKTEINVKVESTGNEHIVKIIDQGPGLTDEDQQLLFKKFQTLSAKPTGGEQSTGLGLSIVKKYVELMKGKVWCESRLGKGSSFAVRFAKA